MQMVVTISFYCYQNICFFWYWPLELAIIEGICFTHVFPQHILSSFFYINFIQIILNHITIMKFNSILPLVNYLNAGWVLLYYIIIFKDKKQKTGKYWKISLSLSLSHGKNGSYIYLRLHTLSTFIQMKKIVLKQT